MDKTQIYDQLKTIFQNIFDEESIELTPELSAKDVKGWDSIAQIRLILLIEKTFNFEFATTELARAANVGDLVAVIEARI
jgi:acyl carrier protein